MPYTAKDLADIEEQISELEKKRREILEDLHLQRYTDPTYLDGDKKLVYEFIKSNPGVDRKQIEQIVPNLTSTTLTNELTTLRRRGFVENRGTKTYSKWHVI